MYRTMEFISLFTDLKPRNTFSLLSRELKASQNSGAKLVKEFQIKTDTLGQMFIFGKDNAYYISPLGARAFIYLYKQGKLPLSQESFNPDVPQDASVYARNKKTETGADDSHSPTPRPELANEVRQADLTEFSLGAFKDSYSFLNRTFIEQFGMFNGSKTMEIQGCQITKSVKETDERIRIEISWHHNNVNFSIARDYTKTGRRQARAA